MKLLLVNDQGQSVACLEDLERYDAREPGHLFALLDFLETLIATAKGSHSGSSRSGDVASGKV